MKRFPENFGTELAGVSFEELFEQHPKWVEYIAALWTADCTGLFKELRAYVLLRLKDPISKAEHEQRCSEYVRSLTTEIPTYLVKYVESKPPRI
mgnify:CR=1 FL=1|jgi:hypothetical protein